MLNDWSLSRFVARDSGPVLRCKPSFNAPSGPLRRRQLAASLADQLAHVTDGVRLWSWLRMLW
jgi:hypothetical protein